MAKKLYEESNISAIAAAIRNKLGSQTTYLVSQMASAINSIQTAILQSKTITPGASQQIITPDSGYNGLSSVIINGDSNLLAENIKKDVSIFGVTGSYDGGSGSGSGVEIVPWSTGTDAEIAAMVAALDAGTLTIADTGWEIGDERVVNLSAMAATDVPETHAAQSVTFVLMDSQHYDLVGGGKDHFVVGMKNSLNEGGGMALAWKTTDAWANCIRRTWCNNVFRNAIPETLRACFKQFRCVAPSPNGMTTTDDYFALFGEYEIFGYRLYSSQAEAQETSQLAYYTTQSNRIKTMNGTAERWWNRTWTGYEFFGNVNSSGTDASYGDSTYNLGISVFGCI